MFKNLVIFDISICSKPLVMGERILLCDEMWHGINNDEVEILESVKDMVCHTINKVPNQGKELIDGDDLNILTKNLYEKLIELELFTKIYATEQSNLDSFQINIAKQIQIDTNQLEIVGWEVMNNLFRSASYDGIYPLYSYSDYFYLKDRSKISPINKWGLFESIESAKKCCDINNEINLDDAPWKPVAVIVDKISKNRLEKTYEKITLL